jgi:hypothetical protein
VSESVHRNRFALKGAMLITTWFPDPQRPTRDLDLLGFGDSSEESILGVFREVCAMPADDGITFEVDNLRIERIREEMEYGGLRLRTVANLSRARINVVVDVGFGDAVEPGLEEIEFPVLLVRYGNMCTRRSRLFEARRRAFEAGRHRSLTRA